MRSSFFKWWRYPIRHKAEIVCVMEFNFFQEEIGMFFLNREREVSDSSLTQSKEPKKKLYEQQIDIHQVIQR